ncbi:MULTISPECIES: hypothetical protein [Chryseobacterium]|uniref:hypothetical protein n=1 Tax=Chryseobacterium TaxID=59732 RepID=UPI0012981FEA|nr:MULTISPECIES: hypothetical protein [Chryseobacterium]MDR6921232.1 hypothetical protein [Chryseobacterium sp. 2987]
MDKSSCTIKPPFVKLEDNGEASILNYNLPQQTTYNSVSYVGLNIRKELFKKEQYTQTQSTYWTAIDEIKQLNTQGIKEAIKTDNNLIQNFAVLDKNIKLQATELSAITKTTLLNKLQQAKTISPELIQLQAVKNDGTRIAEVKSILPTVNIKDIVKAEFIDDDLIAQKLSKGLMPIAVERFSKKPEVLYIPRPKEATPTLSMVLHLKMASYLGDYGAGQTVKTFSLLPGEKTTITVRSYQHDETKKEQSQNVLDSYSESSADDLQNTVEKETQFTTGSSKEETTSKTGGWNAGGSIGLNLGFLSIGGGGGGQGSNTEGSTFNSSVQTQVSNLVGSVSHHVSKADSMRQIEVNSESSSVRINENEETIVRELENINKSRVLNFVFRQLLQEYFSITYLYDVSFVYYNGFPESKRTVKLAQLPELLNEILVDDSAVNEVKNQVYSYLCSIYDFQGTPSSFIEKVEEKLGNCINPEIPAKTTYYVRKRKGLKQVYKDKSVDGIILDVTHRVMRTPSLVVDALLGQGEALDCYNQNLQGSAVEAAELNNEALGLQNSGMKSSIEQSDKRLEIETQKWEQEQERISQAMKIISQINDAAEQAKLYKKIFSECCDVPQSGGCGCSPTAEKV